MHGKTYDEALKRAAEYTSADKAPKFVRIVRRHESESVRAIFYP